MSLKRPLLALCAGLVLAACAGPPGTRTQAPAMPTEQRPSATAHQPASTETPNSLVPAGTALPGTPQAEPAATSAFGPQPGDKALVRGNIFIEDAGIKVQAGNPAQVLLSLSGNRPTPCHQLRVDAGRPQGDGTIQVQVYSVQDPAQVSIQVLKPFAEEVPLGTLPPGRYTLLINDELKLEFSV